MHIYVIDDTYFLHRYDNSLSGSNGYVTCLPSTGNRLGRYYA